MSEITIAELRTVKEAVDDALVECDESTEISQRVIDKLEEAKEILDVYDA